MTCKQKRHNSDSTIAPQGDDDMGGPPLPVIIGIIVVSIICLAVSAGLLHR